MCTAPPEARGQPAICRQPPATQPPRRQDVPEEDVPRLWESYYVVAFARNPWRRAVSQFQFLHRAVLDSPECDVVYGGCLPLLFSSRQAGGRALFSYLLTHKGRVAAQEEECVECPQQCHSKQERVLLRGTEEWRLSAVRVAEGSTSTLVAPRIILPSVRTVNSLRLNTDCAGLLSRSCYTCILHWLVASVLRPRQALLRSARRLEYILLGPHEPAALPGRPARLQRGGAVS